MAGWLVLGPVVFQGFEVPAVLRFGGEQSLVVHDLPGGGRVVDVMGAKEGTVSWKGIVSGADAADRVRLLERLRRSGAVLPLSWEGWLYTVVVSKLTVKAANPAWIPYDLEACVVSVGDMATVALEAAIGVGAGVFGGLTGTAAQVAAVSELLGSADPVVAMGAAGSLARMVAGNAFAGGGGL